MKNNEPEELMEKYLKRAGTMIVAFDIEEGNLLPAAVGVDSKGEPEVICTSKHSLRVDDPLTTKKIIPSVGITYTGSRCFKFISGGDVVWKCF